MQLLLRCLLLILQVLNLMSKVIIYSCIIAGIEVRWDHNLLHCEDLIIMDLIIQTDNLPS